MQIEVNNISCTYSKNEVFERVAVNDVSFNINKGEYIGLIGHTGSGKSTLIQLLSGLIKPDSGSVLIDGLDINSKKTDKKLIRQKIGIVFQYPEYQLFEESVYKDIAFGPINMGKSPEQVDAIVKNVVRQVGLSESILEKSPFVLSGGQKRRVAIAGVLSMQPEILILDEPTAGLDPLARKNILQIIDKLHKEDNTTIILVSHSMEDIASRVDKVMVMSDGCLAMFDRTENVFCEYERLKSIGLDIPQISSVVNKLKEYGIDLGKDIYTVDAVTKAILNYISDK